MLAKVSTLRYIDCMFKLPDFPSVDFSKFDVDALRNIDVSKYVAAVDFSKFEMPKFEMPKFEMPKFEMPTVDMPTVDVAKLTDAVRDLAYLTVGVGVAVAEQVREIVRNAA